MDTTNEMRISEAKFKSKPVDKYQINDIIDLQAACNFSSDIKGPSNFLYNLFRPFLKNKVSDFKTTRMAEHEKFVKKFGITSDILDFVQELSRQKIHFLLAGGKMIDWFNNKNQNNSFNDYDLWFFSQRDYDKALLYFKQLEIEGASSSYNIKPYLVEFVWKLSNRTITVQCVAGCFSGPEEILQDFDFFTSSIGYDGNYIYWNVGTLRDIRNKIIRFQNFREYKLVWLRVLKYLRKGYSISNSNLAFASIIMLSTLTNDKANDKLVDFFFDLDPPLDPATEYYEVDPSRDKWTSEALLNEKTDKHTIYFDRNEFFF